MKTLAFSKYLNFNLKPEDKKDYCGDFFLKAIKNNNIKCHIMGKNFSKQLEKVKLDVVPKYLFNIKESLYIEFAEDIYLSNKVFFSGCVFLPVENGCVVSLFQTMTKQVNSWNTEMSLDEEENYILEEALENLSWDMSKHQLDYPSTKEIAPAIKYAINCILYVSSGNPDLRLSIPPKNKAKSTKGKKKFLKEFPLPLPIVYVGFNYKKHYKYNTNETKVRGHFRWQPCGVKFCSIKLIWIDEYIKYFNVSLNP